MIAISVGQGAIVKVVNATAGQVDIVKENIMDLAGFAIEGQVRQELWDNARVNRWKVVRARDSGRAV